MILFGDEGPRNMSKRKYHQMWAGILYNKRRARKGNKQAAVACSGFQWPAAGFSGLQRVSTACSRLQWPAARFSLIIITHRFLAGFLARALGIHNGLHRLAAFLVSDERHKELFESLGDLAARVGIVFSNTHRLLRHLVGQLRRLVLLTQRHQLPY